MVELTLGDLLENSAVLLLDDFADFARQGRAVEEGGVIGPPRRENSPRSIDDGFHIMG